MWHTILKKISLFIIAWGIYGSVEKRDNSADFYMFLLSIYIIFG